jgi:hypothetical protein
MKWFCIHTDEIWQPDDPRLLNQSICPDNLDITEGNSRRHPMILGQEGSEILHELP